MEEWKNGECPPFTSSPSSHPVGSHTLLCLSILISKSMANRSPWGLSKAAWGQQHLAREHPLCLF